MTNYAKFKFLLFVLLSIAGCKEEITTCEPTEGGELKIIAIGDSRIEGAYPEYESYRYELWKLLVDDGRSFDFAGAFADEADYPVYQGKCFDTDHLGVGGAMTTDVLDFLQEINRNNPPEIVLLGIGGNDLLDGQRPVAEVIENVGQIIIALQNINPDVVIFLEQIAPGLSSFMTTEFSTLLMDYNAQIPTVAANLQTETAKIFVVNMASNWTDEWLADEVHYNESGAREVANRYYESIITHF